MAKKTTPKPKSLKVVRSGRNYTFSWVKNGSYDQSDLDVQHRFKYAKSKKWGKWVSHSVGKKATSFTLKNAPETNLTAVQFRVRSKREGKNYGYSAWAYFLFDLWAPAKPKKVGITVQDNTNTVKFEWSGSHSSADHSPYLSTQLQTMTVKNWNGKYKWAKATSNNTVVVSETSSKTYTDNPPNGGSIARLVRIRRIGTAGNSAWLEMSHVFGLTNQPAVISASIIDNGSTCSISCKWTLKKSAARPVDTIILQHAIGVPSNNGAFNNATWEDGDVLAYKSETMSQKWNADAAPQDDECVWVRVVAKHDGKPTYSEPYRAYKGKIAAPTLGVVTLIDGELTIEAENNSSVPDSYLKAFFRTDESVDWKDMGRMINGEIAFSVGDITNYQVAVQAFAPNMDDSDRVEGDGSLVADAPVPPSTVTATPIDSETVMLTWDWAWENATSFELSWATRADAWKSTNEPSASEVSSQETEWNVGGLEAGQTYYFRVRLAKGELKSRWSDIVTATINPAVIKPATPALNATEFVSEDGTVSFTVGFDGEADMTIAEKIDDEYITLATGNVSASLSLTLEEINTVFRELGRDADAWEVGTDHEICAKVTRNNMDSEWSNISFVSVKARPVITEIVANLTPVELVSVDDQGEEVTRIVQSVTAFPMNITVNGTGEDASIAVSVIRAEPSEIARPDERNEMHFAGEVVYSEIAGFGEQLVVSLDSLTGVLDDGLQYRIQAVATDAYNQQARDSLDFEVHWSHQPIAPLVTVVSEGLITKLTVPEQEGLEEGDTFDIYRLSSDKPELIIRDGVYGETYVDPYPAFGENGGHRVVAKAVNGDYVMEDGGLAWTDTDAESGDLIQMSKAVIDFAGDSLEIDYNLEISNTWEKDFKRTAYLGGSVQGDWNPAVTRDGTIKSLYLVKDDTEAMRLIRDLAVYAGACHVRTPDGSSFWANVEASDEWKYEEFPVLKTKFDFERIDAQALDGMTLAEWNKMNEG